VDRYFFADRLAPRFAVVFLAPLFAAVFLVELLLAALLLAVRRLLVAVLFAAAALAVPVLRFAFNSPSMKVPTFFFVILGRDLTLVSVIATPNQIKLTQCRDFHNLYRANFSTNDAIAT
jgi:hypothetical protein